jgi:CRISPR-associated protein Cmr2
MPNRYIVLSIGPIYKTMLSAKRTRELWGASYLFSWIMKQMILRLAQKGFANEDFIVPFVDTTTPTTPEGVGLFPDMLLVKCTEGHDLLQFEIALIELKSKLTKELQDIDSKLDIPSVSKFVNDYFRFAYQAFEEQANEKPIITAGKISSQLELRSRVNTQGHINPVATLLNQANNSFLNVDGFGSKKHSFPTLIEIATKEIANKDKTEYDNIWAVSKDDKEEEALFIQALQKADCFKNDFRNYHKYIAIVKADGDRIGKTIENWTDDLRGFSKKLYDFGTTAVKAIKAYGGVPIYLGGDDLLFFAPVNNGSSDIFTLCNSLSNDFSQQFAVNNPPTLSFGISISYYKYPLYSALEEADNLLNRAKEPNRNGIAWKVLQHSGQYFDERLNQNEPIFTQFKMLLHSISLEKEHVKSVIQHFRRTDPALWQIIVNIPTELKDEEGNMVSKNDIAINPRAKRIEAYFANFFNEKIHQSKKDFFTTLGLLVAVSLPATNASKEAVESALKNVYALLRTIIFTKGYDLTDD